MTLQSAKTFLLWCIGINVTILLAWSLATWIAHDAVYSLSSLFFGVPVKTFDAVNFAGIVAFKLCVLFFNVVPYIALVLTTRSASPRKQA